MSKKIISVVIVLVTVGLLSNAYPRRRGRISLESAISKGRGRFLLRNESASIPSMPKTIDEFINLRKEIGKTPKGAAVLFIIAMATFVKNKDLGTNFFTLVLDRYYISRYCRRIAKFKGYCPNRRAMYFINRLHSKKYLPGIYVRDTTVNNAYKFSTPATITFNQATIINRRRLKLYINTTSGNRARPLGMKKSNNGYWKANNFSSFFIGGSREPKNEQPDDL